jgi:hypothetical protein
MSEQKINLGDEAKDEITGFQGLCTSYSSYLHGMDQAGLQPPCDKDGKIPDAVGFDITNLSVVALAKLNRPTVTDTHLLKVKLGDTARDPVTNFVGVVTSNTMFINGCTRMGVVPTLDKDGKVQEIVHFPAQRLLLVKSGLENGILKEQTPKEKEQPRSGGPMTSMSSQKVSG